MDLAPLLAAAGVPLAGWTAHGAVLTRRLAGARRDPLTGLHTRDGFTARADHLIRTRPARVTVLLVDLDDFKHTNDTHGHAAGDAVLAAAADRLAAWTGRMGVAARLGGDEFAAAVLDGSDRLPALRSALRRPVPHGGVLLPLSASVGAARVADLPMPVLSDALAAADAAMYAAKPSGRTARRR
ncbi:GGDEF domain-containing protein [Streptacidiphilus sp. ASG 303]|uniref:GGDEF domain-containing protein n=1 Tax=Streptacidiphilus sp. ASG 303 TaxID=2896847 RepID=UPI001E3396F7|nr:GGDEF domain-containing protein [Streptacidiphilus sp. ASG 303]MCD0482333.1 GGDEF domain-containing protein [Streptacidiphilus sp. ASG 303]